MDEKIPNTIEGESDKTVEAIIEDVGGSSPPTIVILAWIGLLYVAGSFIYLVFSVMPSS